MQNFDKLYSFTPKMKKNYYYLYRYLINNKLTAGNTYITTMFKASIVNLKNK